jgi:hypothetical protein
MFQRECLLPVFALVLLIACASGPHQTAQVLGNFVGD